jgi:plastocyanin
MFIVLTGTLFAAGLPGGFESKPAAKEPDKIIEIMVKDGAIVGGEAGKDRAKPVTVVVGQIVRWVNRDTKSHAVTSALKIDDKPLFEPGTIEPGKHKDLLFDIDIYRRAGGKTAGVVTLKFRCDGASKDAGEIQLLSAAKRSLGRP